MSEAGRKRWWRAAAIALVGGGAVTGVWLGFTRSATAEVPAKIVIDTQVSDATWTRSAAPQQPPPQVKQDAAVIPASGVAAPPSAPTVSPASVLGPALPSVPAVPPITPSPLPAVPAVTAGPSAPAIPAPAATPPTAPAVPLIPLPP